MTSSLLRPLAPHDDAEIRRLFRATLCLGQPIPMEGPIIDRYEELCLAWYLGPERHLARVFEEDGVVLGYVLVSILPSQHRWARNHALRFGLRAGLGVALGRYPSNVGHFLRLRLQDGWTLRNTPRPAGVHAHMNVDPSFRDGRASRLFVEHVASVCQRAGSPAWFGEVNARCGRRSAALTRLGGAVVHRAPNHTLTWMVGQPVERLTVVFS